MSLSVAVSPGGWPGTVAYNPGWWFGGAFLDYDFVNNRYYRNGLQIARGDAFNTTRASLGYAANLAGVWSVFPNGAPRLTNKGLLVEGARTNVVLWNRDLTNAAWTASNTTALLNQMGIDGVANSASSLTATSTDGTLLQAITLGSAARWQSAWVKRITGTGTISMTMDNGSTWTAVTVTDTVAWSRVDIPTQTLANPTVGFKLGTSGDAIAIDFVQNENEANTASSPIAVTTVAVARAADVILSPVSGLTVEYSLFAQGVSQPGVQAAGFPSIASLDDGTANDRITLSRSNPQQGTAFVVTGASIVVQIGIGSWANSTSKKSALAAKLNDFAFTFDGSAISADSSGAMPAVDPTQLRIGVNGSAAYFAGYVERIAVFSTRIANAQLRELTI